MLKSMNGCFRILFNDAEISTRFKKNLHPILKSPFSYMSKIKSKIFTFNDLIMLKRFNCVRLSDVEV